jgi:hypothetical protein
VYHGSFQHIDARNNDQLLLQFILFIVLWFRLVVN